MGNGPSFYKDAVWSISTDTFLHNSLDPQILQLKDDRGMIIVK